MPTAVGSTAARPRIAPPSRFLSEIPPELLDRRGSPPGPARGPPGRRAWRAPATCRACRGGRHVPKTRTALTSTSPKMPILASAPRTAPTMVSCASSATMAAALPPRSRRLGRTMSRRRCFHADGGGPPRRAVRSDRRRAREHAGSTGCASAAARSDGLRVEHEDGGGGFAIGQTVRHRQLGLGRVEGIHRSTAGLVTVCFTSGEKKTIKSGFL